jgi:hypothetical protein
MRSRRGPRLLLLLALAGAPIAAGPVAPCAHAQEGWKALVDEGVAHYGAKRYDEAVRAFEAAMALRAEPELVYNIARAHEKALRAPEAIAAYERFLELPGTTAALRAKARAALEALRAEAEAEARARAERPPAGPSPPLALAAAPAPSRALEWTLVGVGAAAAVTGGVFGALALRDHAAFEDARAAGASRAALLDAASVVERNALLADVLVGAGLAAAAVGGLLLWLDDAAPLVPAPAPGGVALGARF